MWAKENHKHVMKQDAINELLYEKSKYHELVVRLKGGDPYVFGRGGEEALYLVDRNVEVKRYRVSVHRLQRLRLQEYLSHTEA